MARWIAVVVAWMALADGARALASTKVVAGRRTSPIAIDGKLDERAWKAAPSHGGFVQREPRQGAPSSERTSFSVLVDRDHVYVGVWAYAAKPGTIRSVLSRRDAATTSDYVTVAFDSFRDRRSGYAFTLNAAGVKRDVALFDDAGEDQSWDAVWEGAASIDERGWYAEFRVPLSQMRYTAATEAVWGLQVLRHITSAGEVATYFPFPQNSGRVVGHFGDLHLGQVDERRRLELLPYLLLKGTWRDVDDALPLTEDVELGGTAGLDAAVGLGSAFTLTATVNPDFGQVEADPAQIDLSGNELFFAEKRPFFVESADLFRLLLGTSSDGAETMVYSRRMGAAPHGEALGTPSQAAELTPILGAAKLSGKTARGWSLGALHVVTPPVRARYVASDGTAKKNLIEPWTHYSVGRLRKQWRDGGTTLGAIATSVQRQLDGYALDEALHRHAYALGGEFDHRFGKDRTWATTWKLATSYVQGTAKALAATQRTQRHLLQRPGAAMGYDGTRTSLAGLSLAGDVGRWTGPGLNYGTGGSVRTPGLELNDLGYQTQADFADTWAWMGVRDEEPGDVFRRVGVNASAWVGYDLSPRVTSRGGDASLHTTWKNWWQSNLRFDLNHSIWQNGTLRGGPSLRGDLGGSVSADVMTDARADWIVGAKAATRRVPAGNRVIYDSGVSLQWQAASNVELAFEASVGKRVDDQYVATTTAADGADDPHYIIATITQWTTSLALRGNITFTPTVSLQAYLQPFVATGAYAGYREVVRPEAKTYDSRFAALHVVSAGASGEGEVVLDRHSDGTADYVIGRPDFNVRDLASNVVLRWEYRPGSTIFAIWSHRGSDVAGDGDYVLGDEVAALAQRGEDRFIVKVNWWFGA
ncbi:MAG: carbohydrate binding family 9 domain-containing protein [Myxococcales bacterium]|nr:carbohydrate binding family 9 domain-containing protein [Myxococcales bacterium]